MQVTDDMVERAKASLSHIRYGLSDAELRRALTAALVDVPAVEPVAGYRRRLPQYAFEHYEFEQPGYENPSISDWEPLYTSPPLSREGEDSAEVIEEGAKVLAKWIGYAWDGLSDRDISAEHKDWAYNGIGALVMQGGKPALRKVAASILALAGSANQRKGGE